MRLLKLSLQNFRNIEEASLEFPPGPQLLIGRNAQGKTSLLESIYYLATATSCRTRLVRELIRDGAETAFVRAEFLSSGSTHVLSAGLDGKTRRFRLDGDLLPKSGDLYGVLRAVFFSPEDLEFVSGGPNVRRRALDLGLCQQNPGMIGRLLEYRRALKQRNATLKRNARTADLENLIRAWDPLLVREGSVAVRERAVYSLRLLELAGSYYSHLTESTEEFRGEYRSTGTRSVWRRIEDVPSVEEIGEALATQLRNHLERDLSLRTTTCGPHRDDVTLSISGASAHRYASQGQRRSIALAVKLAERDLLVEGDESPILLVDDVTHEMDQGRCERFFQKILSDSQVFFTFTEPTAHRGLIEGGAHWFVQAGRIDRAG